MSSSEKPMRKMGPFKVMARILLALVQNRITGQSAKKLLQIHLGPDGCNQSVEATIKERNLKINQLSSEEYRNMAQSHIDANAQMAEKVRKGETGKLMWFVGQMMRQGKGNVEADKAKAILEELLSINSS